MATEPLQQLTEKSAGVGAWMVLVSNEPRDVEFKWTKKGSSGSGRKLEFRLVSEDSTQYCEGVFKKKGREPQATTDFVTAKAKFKKGTIWKVSKASLTNDNPKYLGCSHKVVIDMNSSGFQPVLQSTVQMPKQATPPENLNTLLECPGGQTVDVLALLKEVGPPVRKTTQYGERDVVDITIFDDSGPDGSASCKFQAWFPKSPVPTTGPCHEIKVLSEAAEKRMPVAFFNMICFKEKQPASASEHGESREVTTLRTSREKFSFEICETGAKAERLKNNATQILSTTADQVTVVSELPTYNGPSSDSHFDYLNCRAIFSVCRLLRHTKESYDHLPETDMCDVGATEHAGGKNFAVFQLNHVRIVEPTNGDNVFTNQQDRLFPQVRVIDYTGSLELRMREKAALSISGQDSKDEFADLASKAALNFPSLCTIRVAVGPRKQASAPEHGLDAVIMEAEEQELLIPQAIPNNSLEFVSQLMRSLPADPSRMLVAPMSMIRHVSHAGMVVHNPDQLPIQGSCVLSLVASTGRSVTHDLPGGHKLVSKECWSVPFTDGSTREDGAPEHADIKVRGELASYCTVNNVQDYTLTARRSKDAVYALVVISSTHAAPGQTPENVYMVDKVSIIDQAADVPRIRNVLSKLASVTIATESSEQPISTAASDNDATPFKAKKSRRLSYNPTE